VLISLKESPSKSPQSISHIRCSFEIPALNAIENISNKNMGFFRVISG
jgi:hypothetical protein